MQIACDAGIIDLLYPESWSSHFLVFVAEKPEGHNHGQAHVKEVDKLRDPQINQHLYIIATTAEGHGRNDGEQIIKEREDQVEPNGIDVFLKIGEGLWEAC